MHKYMVTNINQTNLIFDKKECFDASFWYFARPHGVLINELIIELGMALFRQDFD